MNQVPAFEHTRAENLAEALELLHDDALPYHGGTELLAVMRLGLLRPGRLVDLKRVEELTTIERDGDDLVIGGGVTHQAIADSELVGTDAPMLAYVAARVGNMRVRACGTIGGNLVFAEPRSDVASALLALDARVVLQTAESRREVGLDDFILGGYVTDLAPGELLTEVRIDATAGRWGVYRKFQTAERPTVGVALVMDPNGVARLAIGAVGDRPVLVVADDLADLDAHEIARGLDVIEDLSGSEAYKRHCAEVTIRRTIDDLDAASSR